MKNEPIILLARQRSGTHAFKSIMQSHPDLSCTGEVFHALEPHRDKKDNFFCFVEKKRLPAKSLFPWNIEQTFDAFLAHLDTVCESTPFRILDIKYNSTHHFCRNWQSLNQHPLFFDLLKKRKIKVFHLRRKNFLRLWLSAQNAVKLNTFWVTEGAPQTPVRLHVNIEQLKGSLKGMQREDEMVQYALRDCNVFELNYTDWFMNQDGRVPQSELQRASNWLGIDCTFDRTPKYKKQATSSIEEMIENYEEVSTTLKSTEFEWMLRDE